MLLDILAFFAFKQKKNVCSRQEYQPMIQIGLDFISLGIFPLDFSLSYLFIS